MSNIEEIISSFIYSNTIHSDMKKKYSETHRFNSWDICFFEFKQIFTKNKELNTDRLSEKEIEYLALHLGMYLASWGMMRGSAELLQFSYKIHKPIIEILYGFYKDEYYLLIHLIPNTWKN